MPVIVSLPPFWISTYLSRKMHELQNKRTFLQPLISWPKQRSHRLHCREPPTALSHTAISLSDPWKHTVLKITIFGHKLYFKLKFSALYGYISYTCLVSTERKIYCLSNGMRQMGTRQRLPNKIGQFSDRPWKKKRSGIFFKLLNFQCQTSPRS